MMDMEQQVRDAIVAELKRQASLQERGLKVQDSGEGKLSVQGPVDLEELSMVVVGAVAGGP